MKASFHRRVQAEVNEAIAWYENQSHGLGDDFFAGFEEALALIKSHPSRHSFWLHSQTVRRVKLKRFPYDLLYEVRPSQIRVLCLRHRKRHPKFGQGRH